MGSVYSKLFKQNLFSCYTHGSSVHVLGKETYLYLQITVLDIKSKLSMAFPSLVPLVQRDFTQ